MSVFRVKGAKTPSWTYEFEVDRKRYRPQGGSFPTKKLADTAEEKERERVKTQRFEAVYGSIGPKLMTWDEALKKYEEDTKGFGTQAQAMARLRWWAKWSEKQDAHYIQAVTLEVLRKGLKHLATTPGEGAGRHYRTGLSAQTQKHYLARLHAFFNVAVDVWGVMARNPVKQLGKAPVHVRKFKARILELEERRRVILAAGPHMRKVILFGLYTGMREMAIMRLEAEDFQVKKGWLRAWDYKPVRHGLPPEEYFIPLVPQLQKIYQELGIAKGPIWRTGDGSRIRRFQKKQFHRALEAAGFSEELPKHGGGTRQKPTLRFHDFRHMVGVALAEAGIPPAVIQEFMHHATREASEIYTKWISEKAVIAASKALPAINLD
jgi:integrase